LKSGEARGQFWAGALLLAWLLSLILLMPLELENLPNPWNGGWQGCLGVLAVVLGVLLRTFLHTGLFIIGHDAMHEVLIPRDGRANRRWGRLCLALYAGLPYDHCRQQHQRHHRFAGGREDPDCQAAEEGLAPWFVHFLLPYLSWPQMAALLGLWATIAWLSTPFTPSAASHLLLFCVLPLLLSSLQLFLFGTYLPHRHLEKNGQPHQAHSLDLPPWLSLLACYHFSYHWEHHQYPGLAWFELPGSRRRSSGDRVPASDSQAPWRGPWPLDQARGQGRSIDPGKPALIVLLLAVGGATRPNDAS